ncbi:MAG: hypothetical protein ACI9HE_003485 [Planctomycetota bacterium]|jgi:uncharacterized protein YqjF (DUF2071 family)
MDIQLARKPPTGGIDVETTLADFAIVTYCVEPQALRKHVHPRFELDCIQCADGEWRALVSVVPFFDLDFRAALCPWPKWSFGQTNYRAYVTDTQTGEKVAWFFGTVLDTLFVALPRYAWKLPWHRARMSFDVEYDSMARRFSRYSLQARSSWAPAELELCDSGDAPQELEGFSSLESGLLLLTHPTRGYFYRRDGQLGTYSIWHELMQPTLGHAEIASFPLLDRLGLVPEGDLSKLHSVLLQPRIDFTIYLPPSRV